MFCDSDDYVAPGWCEELIELSEKNPDAWVCAGFFIIDSHGCREVLYERENAYSIIKKGNYLQLYKSGLVDDVWNKIFRKEIIIKHNIRFQETLDFGEDTLFVTDYWKKIQYGIVRNIDSLYYYRCWSMETLSNSAAGIRRFNDLTKKIAALKYFMCENEISEFLKVIFWKYSRYSLWHILNFDKYKSISDIIKNFRKVVESSEFQEWYQAAEDKLNDPWIEILRNKDYHSIYEFLSEYYMPYDKENRGLNFETER